MSEDSTFGGNAPEDPTRTVSASHSPTSKPWLPASIGAYRIVRLLGEGGMGAVYEAEQEKPRRTVALKVIKPGLASPALLGRFDQEAQALGRLQHPGIAQIYEAGTADAGFGPQPYFAMEFITGRTLRAYAAAHGLNGRARLELVARICDAVQHAHQRGLIHRDLKPANILVDETGQPKILDFGVARLIDSDAQATRQTDIGQLVGTLAYMSPEQVLADPLALDTRSDVYALGVILYELLAARLPYTVGREVHQAVQTILEEDPAPLSSVNRLYRGDVETIVAKALEKDKERRYASAAELADDIRRHLNDEPIVARPASTVYQLRKFARRHRALVTGVAAVFIVLIAGIIASTAQAARATRAEQAALRERDRATAAESAARQERDRAVGAEQAATRDRNRAVAAEAQAVLERNSALAERQRANVEAATATAVNGFLQNDLLSQASATTQAGGNAKPDPDLKVRTALDRAAARIAGTFADQRLVDASIRQTIGRTYQDLGVYAQSQQHLERALQLRRAELGERHPATLASMNDLAVLYRDQGKYAQAETLQQTALTLRRQVLGPEHRDTLASMHDQAGLYRSQGKFGDAESLELQVLAIRRRLLGDRHTDTIDSRSSVAGLYWDQGKYQQAEPIYVEVVEARRSALGEEHPVYLNSMNDLAELYRAQGKYAQAEPLHIKVIDIQRRVLGEEHPDTLNSQNNLSGLFTSQDRFPEAEALLVKTLTLQRRVLGEEHRNTLLSRNNLALVYYRQGKYADAATSFAEVLQIQRRVLGEEHPDTLISLNNLATTYSTQRKFAEAEPLLTKVLEVQQRVMGEEHPNTLAILNNLGTLHRNQGKYAEAERLLTRSLELRRRVLGEEHPATMISTHNLAVAYRDHGQYDQAEVLFARAFDVRRRVLGEDHADTIATMIDQAVLFRHQGKYAEAADRLTTAVDVRRRTLGPQHPNTINALAWLGRVRVQQQQYGAAEVLLRDAVNAYAKSTSDEWGRYNTQNLLGASLSGQRKYAEAEPLLLAGYEGLAARAAMIPYENRWFVQQAGEWIADLYRDWEQPEKAAEWRDKISKARK